MRLMPARSPKPACSVVPRMPMKMSGNAKSATIRCRSRSSLMKSRCASARIAEASRTGLPHDFEVRVLEAGRMRLHDRKRCFDRAKDRVDGVTVELELEGRAAARHVPQARELVAQARAIGRVDEDVVLDQIALDVTRRPERDDAAFVDDADAVGLLRLLEVVRGQEDRGAARPADLAEVLPERAAARHFEARGRLVQKEDLGLVQEAAHDLELAPHPAREGAHRLVDVARDAKELRELFDLGSVDAMHEPVARRVRVEAVEDRMEADVLLGREVLVEARPLEDDPHLPSHRACLADDVAAVDRYPAFGRRERRREDRDGGRLPRTVRSEQDEELAPLEKKTFEKWRRAVPDDFVYAVKLNRLSSPVRERRSRPSG